MAQDPTNKQLHPKQTSYICLVKLKYSYSKKKQSLHVANDLKFYRYNVMIYTVVTMSGIIYSVRKLEVVCLEHPFNILNFLK